MSRLSKAVKARRAADSLRLSESVENFMGGTSYVVNPLLTMKMVTASSIFGEPSYYRPSRASAAVYEEHHLLEGCTLFKSCDGMTTEDMMESAIDAALAYDFGATLEWAAELRTKFFLRTNPQIIMTRAAVHPARAKWTKDHPGKFNEINQVVMHRADDPMVQMAYYLYLHGDKSDIPSILKRSWAKYISSLNKYSVNKYKNREIKLINAVRICHAHSAVLDELMRTGTVDVTDTTWETLRSAKKSWTYILTHCQMGHMALVRNIRNVFTEINDASLCRQYMQRIKDTTLDSMQFPYRYYTAIKRVQASFCNHQPIIIEGLEECMDISFGNYPKLKGKTICLSDNSGSAWGQITSEYGSVCVAEINNLSSVMTAAASEEGYVGIFGDRLDMHPITRRQGILNQAQALSADHGASVGNSTEGGIWIFFRDAIKNKTKYDNIFIYSDMQAGHGQLYGTIKHENEYARMGYRCNWNNINVFKLIQDYRKQVNPKANIFCVQTAGYDNVLVPEMAYRTAILQGWTGKEAVFAQEYIQLWDEAEAQQSFKGQIVK